MNRSRRSSVVAICFVLLIYLFTWGCDFWYDLAILYPSADNTAFWQALASLNGKQWLLTLDWLDLFVYKPFPTGLRPLLSGCVFSPEVCVFPISISIWLHPQQQTDRQKPGPRGSSRSAGKLVSPHSCNRLAVLMNGINTRNFLENTLVLWDHTQGLFSRGLSPIRAIFLKKAEILITGHFPL